MKVADPEVIKQVNKVMMFVNSAYRNFNDFCSDMANSLRVIEYRVKAGNIGGASEVIDSIKERVNLAKENVDFWDSMLQRRIRFIEEERIGEGKVEEVVLKKFLYACRDVVNEIKSWLVTWKDYLGVLEAYMSRSKEDVLKNINYLYRVLSSSESYVSYKYFVACDCFVNLIEDPVEPSFLKHGGKTLGITALLLGALVAGLLGGEH